MNSSRQDNRASVPDWVRSLIVFCHGCNVMDSIDMIGSVHDYNLKDGMDRHKANRLMIGEMAGNTSIPAYLTLIFWIALTIYTILPDYVSRLYWWLV